MYFEVVQWPESQDVMEEPDWFFVTSPLEDSDEPFGTSAYAREVSLKDIISDTGFGYYAKPVISKVLEEFLDANLSSRVARDKIANDIVDALSR